MYGAILGDIIGSRFEFDRSPKIKEFELFGQGCDFTDDTVMTIAIAEALLDAGKEPEEETAKKLMIASMKKWGHAVPDAGYGGRFQAWLFSRNTEPYGSYGNGSAMRVSPAGWLYDTIEETRNVARWTAEITHNHPEGIKGAESVASVIFLARNGSTKEEIKEYVIKEFGYDLSRTCDDIRPNYRHVESCQETVPEAMTAFFEGDSFEDVIRLAVSLGGDCDTLTDIAGAMAEAYYGIPNKLIDECRNRVTEQIREVMDRFDVYLNGEEETKERVIIGFEGVKNAAESGKEEAFTDAVQNFIWNEEGQPEDTPEIRQSLKEYLMQHIINGNTVAMVQFAAMHAEGRLTEKDPKIAFQWYKRASDMGNILATSNLGFCYLYGNGTEINYEEAFKAFSKAAVLGMEEAYIRMGDMYLEGLYVEKDVMTAFRLYKMAYNSTDDNIYDLYNMQVRSDAGRRIGECYYNGYGVEKDVSMALSCYADALYYYEKRKEKGDSYCESGLVKTKARLKEITSAM